MTKEFLVWRSSMNFFNNCLSDNLFLGIFLFLDLNSYWIQRPHFASGEKFENKKHTQEILTNDYSL
jgi:hypothetical protein